MITIFANFWRKNWRFSQKQCHDQCFAKISSTSSKKRQFSPNFFGENAYLKNHNCSKKASNGF
jgi:hypothetical protein